MRTQTSEQVPIDSPRLLGTPPLQYSPTDQAAGSRQYLTKSRGENISSSRQSSGSPNSRAARNKSVLEIGSGIGTDTMNFARHESFGEAVGLSRNT